MSAVTTELNLKFMLTIQMTVCQPLCHFLTLQDQQIGFLTLSWKIQIGELKYRCTVTPIPFRTKNTKKTVLTIFWAYVGQPDGHIVWVTLMPFASINSTNPRICDIFAKIAQLLVVVENLSFFESAILIFFASFLFELVTIYWVPVIFQNFDD